MQKVWRIKDLLEWTTRYFGDRGISEARLEAEILLAHVIQKDRVYLYANYEEPVNITERTAYREYIKRRTDGEPVAYIIGHKEFMSLDFKVTPEVLIPRPDTEVLVEKAITIARQDGVHTIIDVGTGSGAIAVSLAVYLQNVEIYAVDISARALDIARENAHQHQVNIQFVEGDLLTPFMSAGLNFCQEHEHKPAPESFPQVDNHLIAGKNDETKGCQENRPLDSVDMITANLPYIPAVELEQIDRQVKDFEPHLALFSTGDGLDIYRRLIPQAYALLRSGGVILMEIDPRQAGLVPAMMQGFTDILIIKDWAGRERMVQARREKDD